MRNRWECYGWDCGHCFHRAVGILFIGLFLAELDIIMGQSLVLEILGDDAVDLSFGNIMGKALQSLE